MQWTGTNQFDLMRWAEEFAAQCQWSFDETTIQIKTLEGIMTAQIGDWIIIGVQGEQYPCKPDIFEKTYVKAGESES